jgi:DNA-damage-inducible protein D
MTMIQPATPFDSIRKTGPDASEYWSARDLMPLLGYSTWRNFSESIDRAAAACRNSGMENADHFADASKVINGGKGAKQTVSDLHLSRYAAYLIAMNGDSRKPEIAAAQTYFTVQTRRAEIQQATATLPASPLALSRALLEALEQQDTRVTAIEKRLDASPITSEKVGTIHRLGQQLGQAMGNYRRAWVLFNEHFGLASYRDLPTHRYEEGVKFLRMQCAAYLGVPLLEVQA